MGFLDNSGDIILDAVLTDLGRERLARGDGSFKITKFALADDEINYGSYNKNHASGSAYYDLEVLQTPVLEAFTNNGSSMKSRLLSLSRNDILYLPVLKLNQKLQSSLNPAEDSYLVAVDATTEDATTGIGDTSLKGVLMGYDTTNNTNEVMVDQGLDTTEIATTQNLSSDLIETQYLIEMDNRLGSLTNKDGSVSATLSFIDDDNIAYYYITSADSDFFEDITGIIGSAASDIAGPRGTRISFSVQANIDLQTSTSLFTRLGAQVTAVSGKTGSSAGGFRVINTIVRVSGVTTGYRLDIPVKYVKTV